MCRTRWKGKKKQEKNSECLPARGVLLKIRVSLVLFFSFLLVSLLTQSRTKRAQAAQELRDREEVEKELSVVKAWIQETRELLLNPTPDIDSLLQELEVHGKKGTTIYLLTFPCEL